MFKKTLITISAICLALSSCSGGVATTGADDYKFEFKDFTTESSTVKIVYHQNLNDLHKTYKVLTNGEPSKENGNVVRAFSLFKYNKENNTTVCTIHLIDPFKHYEPEFIGHELMHCIHGHWHPGRGGATKVK